MGRYRLANEHPGATSPAEHRADAGYYTSDRDQLESATYATAPRRSTWVPTPTTGLAEALLGEARIRVDSNRPIFVGIGPDVEVARYLGPVEYVVMTRPALVV